MNAPSEIQAAYKEYASALDIYAWANKVELSRTHQKLAFDQLVSALQKYTLQAEGGVAEFLPVAKEAVADGQRHVRQVVDFYEVAAKHLPMHKQNLAHFEQIQRTWTMTDAKALLEILEEAKASKKPDADK